MVCYDGVRVLCPEACLQRVCVDVDVEEGGGGV